jgi:hypothetical protein
LSYLRSTSRHYRRSWEGCSTCFAHVFVKVRDLAVLFVKYENRLKRAIDHRKRYPCADRYCLFPAAFGGQCEKAQSGEMGAGCWNLHTAVLYHDRPSTLRRDASSRDDTTRGWRRGCCARSVSFKTSHVFSTDQTLSL